MTVGHSFWLFLGRHRNGSVDLLARVEADGTRRYTERHVAFGALSAAVGLLFIGFGTYAAYTSLTYYPVQRGPDLKQAALYGALGGLPGVSALLLGLWILLSKRTIVLDPNTRTLTVRRRSPFGGRAAEFDLLDVSVSVGTQIGWLRTGPTYWGLELRAGRGRPTTVAVIRVDPRAEVVLEAAKELIDAMGFTPAGATLDTYLDAARSRRS